MYALYGHSRPFKFKWKSQQYGPCFHTIFPFLMTMLIPCYNIIKCIVFDFFIIIVMFIFISSYLYHSFETLLLLSLFLLLILFLNQVIICPTPTGYLILSNVLTPALIRTPQFTRYPKVHSEVTKDSNYTPHFRNVTIKANSSFT